MNLARLSQKNNYQVIICCDIDIKYNEADFNNIIIENVKFRNSEFNIVNEFNNFKKIKSIYLKYKPNICHFITIKPILYASILSKQLKDSKVVVSFTGIGFIAINKNIRARLLKSIFFYFTRKLFKYDNIHLIFQNTDDLNYIYTNTKFNIKKSYIIPGSGVDLVKFRYNQMPNTKYVNFLFASRLLKDKGIIEFLKASEIILNKKLMVKFIIIGEIDKNNPTFINPNVIKDWNDNKSKFFYSYKENIIDHIIDSDVIVLPSYREGLPKILIEACAIGRPILTTNVPGCKECVEDGKNGFLFDAQSVESLVKAIEKIVLFKDKYTYMSLESRKIAENKFSIKYVDDMHKKIYNL